MNMHCEVCGPFSSAQVIGNRSGATFFLTYYGAFGNPCAHAKRRGFEHTVFESARMAAQDLIRPSRAYPI